VLIGRYRQVPWRRAIRASIRAQRKAGSVMLPERLEGAVYGHLVGDALGVPYEFGEPGPFGEIEWRGGGLHAQPPGTWSDDGALMLSLLDSLLSVGFDTDDQGRRALDWRDLGHYAPAGTVFDIGGATSAALERIRSGVPAAEAGGADAKGNGSLMRILPLPLVLRHAEPRELAQAAARASRVTHASAEAQVACAVRAARAPAPRRRARSGRRPVLGGHGPQGGLRGRGSRDHPVARAGRGSRRSMHTAGPGRDETGGRQLLVGQDAFAGSSSYAETVTRAVAYGHDTDTTAAIAGGLAGAYWGIAAIPPAWRRGLRDQRIPRELIDRLIETDQAGWDGRAWRTSTANPLRVDRLDLAQVAVGSGGGVGITFLPGKRYIGFHTGAHWRDLDADAARLRELGVDVLLLLVEDRELERCRVIGIGEALAAQGVELVRFPIRDPLVPDDGAAFRATGAGLLGRVRDGASLAIACRGGLDRSGMAAGCLLREAGFEADEAIARVQRARKGALTLPEQQAYVRRWPPAP
jgi:ADP-ribosylglycohydrolase